MALYETIGTSNPTYLLADPQGSDLIPVSMEPGNGTVKRGTVIYRKSTGFWAPAAADQAVITNELAVLNETVDTTGVADGSSGTIAEDAHAFRAGRLIAGKVTLANDAVLTDAVKVVLRTQGIVLDPMVGTATFNNVKA